METYNNSYAKDEDRMLWELHEIRHKLQKKREGKTWEEINREAFEKYYRWREKRDRQPSCPS